MKNYERLKRILKRQAFRLKDYLSGSVSVYTIGILVCYVINAMFVDTVRRLGQDIFLIMVYGAAIAAIRLANNKELQAK